MHMTYNAGQLWSRWGASVLQNGLWNRTNSKPGGEMKQYSATVNCYPLSSLLIAANFTKLDFLSLDLEGVELQVLKTVKWDFHDIKVTNFLSIIIHTYYEIGCLCF